MMTELDWNGFCELYYEPARHCAEVHLKNMLSKSGGADRFVDLDYVKDSAILTSLEKAFVSYDANRGAKITTYLSTLVHNALADELGRETKKAEKQQDISDLKAAIRFWNEDDTSDEAREKLIPRLRAAISRLSPSDQIILDYYLEDKSTYIARSVESLHITENYVSVRRNAIFKRLPKLMEMSRSEYIDLCYEQGDTVFAKSMTGKAIPHMTLPSRSIRTNPILPGVSVSSMARRLADLLTQRA